MSWQGEQSLGIGLACSLPRQSCASRPTRIDLDTLSAPLPTLAAYVDTSLIGTGKIARAAIIGVKGGVWATSAGYTVRPSARGSGSDRRSC